MRPTGWGDTAWRWILPGPWLEPGFRQKGYEDLQERVDVMVTLIDHFNALLEGRQQVVLSCDRYPKEVTGLEERLKPIEEQGEFVVDRPGLVGARVLDERVAYLITDILSDEWARLPSFGEGSALYLGRPAAASPATGYPKIYRRQQDALIDEAVGIEEADRAASAAAN